MSDGVNHSFKVVVVGPFGTGKTSLVSRFTGQGFEEYVKPTVCAGFTYMDCNYLYMDPRGETAVPVKFTEFFWDTAGQEKYTTTLLPQYMRDADVLLLVFNVADFSDELFNAWLHKIADIPMQRPPAVFVALNKIDLLNGNDMAKWTAWARHINLVIDKDESYDNVRIWSRLFVYLTSAKLKDGITQLHEGMQSAQALMVLEEIKNSKGRVILTPRSEDPCRKQDSSCC